jgi:hypothetical protein
MTFDPFRLYLSLRPIFIKPALVCVLLAQTAINVHIGFEIKPALCATRE